MNAVVQLPQPSPSSQLQALVPTNIEQAFRLAEMMSQACLVPDHLRNKPGDCMLVVMQAQRWGLDAVSVAQCTSVVHGKLCYEGKLIAAVLHAMGAIEGRLHYDISGSGQGASIVVTGTPRGGREQSVSGSVKDWRTVGKDKQGNRIDNAWDKMPEDMLVYRGTRQWARRYAPEALLGVYTPDEVEEIDVTPRTVRNVVATQPAQLQPYSEADFAENFPKWQAVIESGRRTAAEIVAMVETKATLSESQRASIFDLQPPEGSA